MCFLAIPCYTFCIVRVLFRMALLCSSLLRASLENGDISRNFLLLIGPYRRHCVFHCFELTQKKMDVSVAHLFCMNSSNVSRNLRITTHWIKWIPPKRLICIDNFFSLFLMTTMCVDNWVSQKRSDYVQDPFSNWTYMTFSEFPWTMMRMTL